MDVRSLFAAQKYAASLPALEPDPTTARGTGETFADAARSFEETLRAGEQVSMQTMTGDADPHALVEALAQSELAVETVVAIRNKVVEAYQELLRMPV
jgi:flagellar hook-basal body complex protein FliE